MIKGVPNHDYDFSPRCNLARKRRVQELELLCDWACRVGTYALSYSVRAGWCSKLLQAVMPRSTSHYRPSEMLGSTSLGTRCFDPRASNALARDISYSEWQ